MRRTDRRAVAPRDAAPASLRDRQIAAFGDALAPGELDDDISDLFHGVPAVASTARASTTGTRFENPSFILEAAAAIEAERKAEGRAAAAETRRINAAARKAAQGDAAPKPRAPRKARAVPTALAELTGRAIPATITGTIAITGTMRASTGDALIVDVTGANNVARGIVVWAGHWQGVVRDLAAKGARARIEVRQPANDCFRPSVGAARAA